MAAYIGNKRFQLTTALNISGGSNYTAGYGIDIQDNTISVDTSVIATQQYVEDKIGAINNVLDAINGEVI